jgi:hypothetical protein
MTLRIGLLARSALQNDWHIKPVILQSRTPQESNPKGHLGPNCFLRNSSLNGDVDLSAASYSKGEVCTHLLYLVFQSALMILHCAAIPFCCLCVYIGCATLVAIDKQHRCIDPNHVGTVNTCHMHNTYGAAMLA